MTRRAVKPKSTPPIRREGAIPITTPLNISALAREHGVSRKTIQRRLAKGWRPEAHTPAQVQVRANAPLNVRRDVPVSVQTPIVRARAAPPTHLRPPLGVVRGVLLLLAVGFYVFVACAAVGVRG